MGSKVHFGSAVLGLTLVIGLFPAAAFGQADSGVIFVPSAVFAFQPKDTYFGSPYLFDHLGGFGWGGALSLLREDGNLVFGGEINHAFHSKELSGRVSNETPRQVNFHETFLTGVLGYSDDGRYFQAVGGGGVTLGEPRSEGVSQNSEGANHWFVVTGGFNFFVPSSARVRVAFGLRYSYVFAGDRYTYVGLSKNVFRGTVGVAFGSP